MIPSQRTRLSPSLSMGGGSRCLDNVGLLFGDAVHMCVFEVMLSAEPGSS